MKYITSQAAYRYRYPHNTTIANPLRIQIKHNEIHHVSSRLSLPLLSQHDYRQTVIHTPLNLIEITLGDHFKAEGSCSRRTRERRRRSIPGTHSPIIRDMENTVREVSVRPLGVRVGGSDWSADAEQLHSVRVGSAKDRPTADEGKAAGFAAVAAGNGEGNKGVCLVLDAVYGLLLGRLAMWTVSARDETYAVDVDIAGDAALVGGGDVDN